MVYYTQNFTQVYGILHTNATQFYNILHTNVTQFYDTLHTNVSQFYDISHTNVTQLYGILHINVTQVELWSQTGSLTPSPDYWDQKVELCQFASNLSCCHWSGLWDNLKFDDSMVNYTQMPLNSMV